VTGCRGRFQHEPRVSRKRHRARHLRDARLHPLYDRRREASGEDHGADRDSDPDAHDHHGGAAPEADHRPDEHPAPAAGSFCAIFNAAGGAALGAGSPLIVGQDYGAPDVCYESNSYRNIIYENSGATEYPRPASRP